MKRFIILVLDSVGAGAAPDAAEFGDEGADTIGGVLRHRPDIQLNHLKELGFFNIEGTSFYQPVEGVKGCYGKCMETSKGKDTTVGHWEIAGIVSETPFPTYPNGFPEKLIKEFEKMIGRGVIGNYASSGTAIIEKLGQQHVESGDVIVYTSADSVFQIAAHENVVPLEELYDICRKARKHMCGEHAVSRIIARPFIGEDGAFKRTANRRDFSLSPPRPTVLDAIKDSGQEVVAIGKIEDIFTGKGVTRAVHTHGNTEGLDITLNEVQKAYEGLLFVNLVDFDMLYGHRNDPDGYAEALKEVDEMLPKIMAGMQDQDILVITADHGCDPTFKGTDHTREMIPLLIWGKNLKEGVNLGIRDSFADIGKTATDYLGVTTDLPGQSFIDAIK